MMTRSAADARIRAKAECHSFCPIGFSEYLRSDGKLEAEIVGGTLGYNTTYSGKGFLALPAVGATFPSMITAKVIGTGELNRVPESEPSPNRARQSPL
jgi:hypothetical protein